MEDDVRVRWEGLIERERDELAGHAEMGYQHVAGVEFEEYELAAAPDAGDKCVAELAIEARTRNAGSDAFEVQFSDEYAPSDNDWRQGSDDVFYFGKFRHKTS